MIDKIRRRKRCLNVVGRISFTIMVVTITFSPIIYYAVLNFLGPSTEYYEPEIETAVQGPDGRPTIYLGDQFWLRYTIVRHQINGNCHLKIWRWGEHVDGPTPGARFLIDYAELRFVGQNEMRRPRWPSPPRKYFLGYAVNEQIEAQHDKPLLPEGVDVVTMDFYNTARYYCNIIDYFIPRWLQGGRPNETERARAVLRRYKP